jgi:hypothetical protein
MSLAGVMDRRRGRLPVEFGSPELRDQPLHCAHGARNSCHDGAHQALAVGSDLQAIRTKAGHNGGDTL